MLRAGQSGSGGWNLTFSLALTGFLLSMTPSYDGLDIIQILVMMDSMLVQTENVVISVVKLLSVDLTTDESLVCKSC